MPITLVNPKMDIGRDLAFEPAQTSLMVPPTILIDTDEAPPPKNRVTSIVAKFCENANPKMNATRIM